MAAAVTVSPAGPRPLQTVTFTITGLTASTNYWLALNEGTSATVLSQQTGAQHANFDMKVEPLSFKSDGSGNATVKWVPQVAATWQYQIITQPTYSSVASSTGSVVVTGAN